MRLARASLRAGIGVAAITCAFAIACGSKSGVDACTIGWRDCPCSPTEPCAPGLVCSAGICVDPRGGPAAGADFGGPFAGASAGGARAGASAGGRLGFSGAAQQFAGSVSAGGSSGGRMSVAGAAGSAGTGGVVSEPPVVLILLDGSSSMYDRQVWTPTYEALTGPEGPIVRYEGRVRFGFASYRGTMQTVEEDPACAKITSVPFALSNAASIRDVYATLAERWRGRPWETPTGHALTRVTETLLAEPTQARKYILLISDGAPDTCLTGNPQCGQDRAILAVQSAFRAGIETRAIGIGFGNEYPGCTSDTARCGGDHFQDLANAGRGLPVIAPPEAYLSLACAAETGGQLLSEYSDVGGKAGFFWTRGPMEVANAVDTVLAEVLAR